MKRLLTVWMISMGMALAACGDSAEPEPSNDDAFVEVSPADSLAAAQEVADSKSDEPVPCGEDSCARALCGYDCTTSGSQCERACAPEDARPETTVRFEVSGAASASMDSTTLGYNPALRLQDVLIYGCDVWDFSNQSKDGLEIKFNEVIDGAFLAGDPETIGNKAWVYIAPFEGPGSYIASGYFRASSSASTYYYGEEACGVEISAMENGGIQGTVSCGSIPAKEGAGSVVMNGEFSCGINATDLLFTDLTP